MSTTPPSNSNDQSQPTGASPVAGDPDAAPRTTAEQPVLSPVSSTESVAPETARETPAPLVAPETSDERAAEERAAEARAAEERAAEARIVEQRAAEERAAEDGAAAQRAADERAAEERAHQTDSQVVYVSAPQPPATKGARGVGAAVALLSTVVFAAVYAGLVLLLSLLVPPTSPVAIVQYFSAPTYWIPVLVFALSYLLLVVIVNRAGWWAHVLGGFIVAVVVYISFIGAALIVAEAVGGAPAVVGSIVLAQLANPLGFAAAIAAREVPIWVGGIVARRGRTVAARNVEAREAYERDLEAHRASVAAR